MLSGTASYHYREKHPEYARWANIWLGALAILVVSGAIAANVLGPSGSVLTRIIIVTYLFGGLAVLGSYRFLKEYALRKDWKDPLSQIAGGSS